ncbi:glycosyltransferase family 4 protein [Halocella sp. SP3-1]|uniref:glycosyltransferase family 4 protein n=1 Tax=Halocella sp. SP3-1 TaxID=2382161 RepID=UPI000F75D481|nr:glycosyltransferase family 4 protein [Halocella sp. SP3-1]AZO93990.1 glycosyltransferase family 4 protein [Halocella sp. SP3-1]
MRIGVFSDSYKPYLSGVVKSIESFSYQLRKKGHQVYIFAPDYPEAEKKKDVFRFRSLPVPTNDDFRLAIPISSHIIQQVKKLELDIIHTHSPFMMGWLGRHVAQKLSLPLVFTYHTLYGEYAHYAPFAKGLARKLVVKYSRDYCQTCDIVITPTEFVKKRLLSYGITTPVRTIPTGISLEPYQASNGKDIRERYKDSADEKLLLFVGRLGQEKNVELLIKSFKVVRENLSKCKLLIIGDGPERKKLARMSRKLLVDDYVVFTGQLSYDKVIDYYCGCDLFVFPSVTETQGLVILEAMAGGMPVTAINAAGSSIMVDNNINGILTKDDYYLFANGIIDILTDEEKYKYLKENALKKAADLSMDKMADRLIASYQEALSQQRAKKSLA